MNQLNDVSFMQMIFQIFKITIHLSNMSISNSFFFFHWKLCTCVALFEKLEFNEKVLNLKLVDFFLKAITEANIFCLSTLFHTFVKVYSCNGAVFFLCTYFNAHQVIVIDKIITF